MLAAARSKLCRSVSAWSGVFASIAMSENSLQKLSKKPNKHKCLKTKTAQYQLAGIYIKEQDRIHSKSDR